MSAPANRWLVLVAMTGSLSMIMLDQTVVTVALPAMSDDLGLRPTGQQWVVNAYVLALTALVAFGGKLGDRVGGVRTFRLGVAGFFVASALCGLAPAGGLGEAWIIAARALQGAAAALMVPTPGPHLPSPCRSAAARRSANLPPRPCRGPVLGVFPGALALLASPRQDSVSSPLTTGLGRE